MLEPRPPSSESERILRWYALVQDAYELADALPQSAVEPSMRLGALLGRAAVYFGLEAFEHRQGRPPSPPAPGDMIFPLPPTPAEPSRRPPAPEAEAHYLRARPGPHADTVETLRPLLQRFVRHVERSMQTRQSLAAARHSLAAVYETLNRQALAVVLCDAQGRPRFFNRAAVRLRARCPELRLDREGSDGMRREQQPQALLFERFREDMRRDEARIIHLATDSLVWTLVPLLSRTTSAAFAADGPSLGLIVQERSFRDEPSSEREAVLPEVPDALSRRLQERFALTPAELRLSHGLYAGLSVARYAALARRSPLTVRKQLKSICRKLQVPDQKTLILRVWQEQQADWLRCVTFLAAPCEKAGPSPTLLYPQSPPPRGSLAPERARHLGSPSENDRVDG